MPALEKTHAQLKNITFKFDPQKPSFMFRKEFGKSWKKILSGKDFFDLKKIIFLKKVSS